MTRVFLCHASEDKPKVREVYHRLKTLGFEPWFDEENLLPGQTWDYEIEKALEASDFVIMFLSERSVEKIGDVQREFQLAMDRSEKMPKGFIYTIPVKLDNCEAPHWLSRLQWTNLKDDNDFNRIVRALHHGLQQRDKSKQSILTNSVGMEFVLIPAGEFLMGSSNSDPDAEEHEKPQHRVMISQSFYMGVHPVTQAQWVAVMDSNPSHFKGRSEHPVENVSWQDVQQFLQRLNALEDSDSYGLPSEAQWEYACHAGSLGTYCFGDDEKQLRDYAWYGVNSNGTSHPVGEKQANAWGLYDMHGNVREWVQDGRRRYTADAVTDPEGPTNAGTSTAWRK